ncbi:hypothetical protein EDB19DRAFT_1777841 [Suillus lakei]|nr:hypothetical protein EDB19DRAFT_1777841 [Suillus lakei]
MEWFSFLLRLLARLIAQLGRGLCLSNRWVHPLHALLCRLTYWHLRQHIFLGGLKNLRDVQWLRPRRGDRNFSLLACMVRYVTVTRRGHNTIRLRESIRKDRSQSIRMGRKSSCPMIACQAYTIRTR